MDPNMGLSPASSKRGVTWLDEFAAVGLNFALADDSDVGRGRINEYLRPGQAHLAAAAGDRPPLPADDFPDEALCLGQLPPRGRKRPEAGAEAEERRFSDDAKYLMNTNPSFNLLHRGAPVVRYNRGYDSRTAVRT
jgi:hypothetical protein